VSEMMVCVIHVVVEPYKAPFFRRSLEEKRDDGIAWHGYKLMKGVLVKEMGNGVFAQSFNSDGNIEELSKVPGVVRVGIFKGLYMHQVIHMHAEDMTNRETVIFSHQAVAA